MAQGSKTARKKLYGDLLGIRVIDDNLPATIPSKILSTPFHLDILLMRAKEIVMIELTLQYNSSDRLHNARLRKKARRYTGWQSETLT